MGTLISLLMVHSWFFQSVDSTPRQIGVYCTGTGDTARVQAALNIIGTGGGELSLNNCTLGALTIQSQLKSLVLRAYGTLTLTAQLVLPGLVHLIGESDGSIEQFQRGPTVRVIPPPGTTAAAIKIIGSAGQTVENISMNSADGPGILIDGAGQLGALVKLKNVCITSSLAATSVPVLIDAAFWVWIEDSCLNSRTTGYPASLRVTTSSAVNSSAGLIYVKDTIISGHGIQLDAQVTVSQQGNISFDRVTYENALNSIINIDSTNGVAAGIYLNFIAPADQTSLPYIIKEIGSAPQGIRAVSVVNSSGVEVSQISNVPILGLNYQADDAFDYSTGYAIGPQQRYAILKRGVLDAEWNGGHTANQLQNGFGATYAVQQDVTQWSGLTGSGVVTTGKIAPDGSATAAEIASASGTNGRQPYRATPTLTVGDWLIAGVWIRSEDPTMPTAVATGNSPNIGFNPSTGNTFAGLGSLAFLDGDVARRIGSEWSYIWTAQKIATISGTPELIFGLNVDATHPADFWMPWMIRIPNGTMSDQDVLRYARSTSSLPSSLPSGGGVVTLAPNQTLQIPKITVTSAPSSAGSGGLYLCVDNTGATYKKASCP